jgi:hypothetical protein
MKKRQKEKKKMTEKKTKDTIVNSQADKLLIRNQITYLNWESLPQLTTSLTNTCTKVLLRGETLTYQEILKVLNCSLIL